jgi:Tfp pilus assembly protein PilV
MKRSLFIIISAVVLVVSIGISAFVFLEYQSVLQAKNDLNQQLVDVQNQLTSIREQQANNTDKQTEQDFNLFYGEFGGVSIQSRSYNFSPPVSMYNALRIALESGNWTITSLKGRTVSATLEHCVFWHNSTATTSPSGNSTTGSGLGFQVLNEVTQPIDDYSPVISNETTYRYIWSFAVIETDRSSLAAIAPLGIYWVDAATAELVPPVIVY